MEELELEYRRTSHLLPTMAFVAMFLSFAGLIGANLQHNAGIVGFAYLLILGVSATATGLIAWLTGRFVFKRQRISISPGGITASYLNRGQTIPWIAIERTVLHKRGIALVMPSRKSAAELFVRPAIEARGLPIALANLHSIVESMRRKACDPAQKMSQSASARTLSEIAHSD